MVPFPRVGVIASLTLPLFAAAMEPVTIVTLGDSITKGVREGVSAEATFSNLLEERLSQQGRSVRVLNQGVGGETTEGALDRLDRDVLALRPNIVVVMYGTNDCYVDSGKTESRISIGAYRHKLEQMLKRIRAVGAEPILMTEPCYAKKSPANGLGEHGNLRLSQYMAACRQLASRRDVVLIDHFSDWTTALDAGQSIEEWTTDGYHPNPQGHARMTDTMMAPIAAAVDACSGSLEFQTRIEEVLSHDDGKFLWYHARAVAFPIPNSVPQFMMTLQKHLIADDHYDGLATMKRTGNRWTMPEPAPALAWRKDDSGATIAVCDVTPGYHAPSGKVLAFGAKVLYDDAGQQLTNTAGAHQVAVAVYSPSESQWSPWQFLDLPETAVRGRATAGRGADQRYFLATAGCAQWIVEDSDGNILLPVYHKGPTGEAYSVTVLRCAFDGQRLSLLEEGDRLDLAEVRGLCEPSLARYRGRYFLTLRNDVRGYVTTSDDGLHYAPITPWRFDDGAELGSYNTQQHWLVHSDGLFLVYTRRGADNDHILRHRAPLFLARVDTDSLRVVRGTEKVLIPERGGEFGNFGANPVSAEESWVTVGEGVWNAEARQRGAKGTVFIAHVEWSKPNRLRGGSGPGAWIGPNPSK